MLVINGIGSKGGYLKRVYRLQDPPRDGEILQVPGESAIGGGWWLADGGPKYCQGAESVVENVEDTKQGEGKTANFWIFL